MSIINFGKKLGLAATKVGKKVNKLVLKYPKTTLVTGMGGMMYAYSKTPLAQQTQNQIIEMQKIDKERKTGKKFTRKQLTARLDKAKLSKRKFTWWG